MKTTKMKYIAAIAAIVLLAGCGSSVSAPPVDLPAPITGRIDVSAPDEDGNVVVTGSEGAVEGGSLVMVVNESESAALELRLWDLIVPSAYAAEYPDICSEEGHSCTYADEDGSFIILIKAGTDDALTIGVIDPETGEWLSETITVSVPQSGDPNPDTESCEGLGLTGKVVDVAIAPIAGVPVLLKEGSDTTFNELIIGEEGETTVEVSGCYAHSLAIKKTSTGDLIVVTSKDDKRIWAGRLAGGAVGDTRSYSTTYEPMHLVMLANSTAPIVAMRASNSVVLQQITLADGSALETMEIYYPSASTKLTGVTRSVALDVIRMNNTLDEFLGLLITDKGDNVSSFVTIFRADNLTHKLTKARTDIDATADDVMSIVDGAFYINNGEQVRIAVLDSASTNNSLIQLIISVTLISVPEELEYNDKLSSITSWDDVRIGDPAINSISSYNSADIGLLRRLGVSKVSDTLDEAIVATSTGWLVKQQLYFDTAPSSAWEEWDTAADFVAIFLSDGLQMLYGADAASGQAIDGSTLIY